MYTKNFKNFELNGLKWIETDLMFEVRRKSFYSDLSRAKRLKLLLKGDFYVSHVCCF